MKQWQTLARAVAAGIMIGIGAAVFLASENKVVGAVLFSVGLLTICMYGLNLYTGKVGYLLEHTPRYTLEVLLIWVGNLIGTLFVGQLLRFARAESAQKALGMVQAKLAQNVPQTLVLGALCGLLMYVAVDNFRRNEHPLGKYLGILFCVPTFILCGFEHSIADMAYFAVALDITALSAEQAYWFVYILLVSLGNLIGALVLPLLMKVKPREIKET